MKSRKECWSDSWKISTLVHRLNLIFYVLRVCLQVRHIHKRMPKIITLNTARTNQSPPFANAPPHKLMCAYLSPLYMCVRATRISLPDRGTPASPDTREHRHRFERVLQSARVRSPCPLRHRGRRGERVLGLVQTRQLLVPLAPIRPSHSDHRHIGRVFKCFLDHLLAGVFWLHPGKLC